MNSNPDLPDCLTTAYCSSFLLDRLVSRLNRHLLGTNLVQHLQPIYVHNLQSGVLYIGLQTVHSVEEGKPSHAVLTFTVLNLAVVRPHRDAGLGPMSS